MIDRLHRAKDNMRAMPLCGLGDAAAGIIGRRHAPGTGVALRKADEIRPFAGGATDPARRVVDFFDVIGRRVRVGLHDRDVEARQLGSPVGLFRMGGIGEEPKGGDQRRCAYRGPVAGKDMAFGPATAVAPGET